MSKIAIARAGLLYLSLFISTIQSAIYDNRFVPEFEQMKLNFDGLLNSWRFNLMLGTTSVAINDNDSQQEIGIPEIFGRLDEGTLGMAIEQVGKTNPLPPEWVNRTIPYRIAGKQQIEGFTFNGYQMLNDWLFVGFSALFMRFNAYHNFALADRSDVQGSEFITNTTPAEREQLNFALREMFTELALRENHAAQTGFGDADLFAGFHKTWLFCAKFRRMDLDLRLGLIAPTGIRRDLDLPASIPFGGDGHWGFYGDVSGLFELREDIKVGLRGRIIKRFPRTRLERLSVAGEPTIFGATVGEVRRRPGLTYVFAPFIAFEHLRNGFGVSLGYTFTHHSADNFQDRRPLAVREERPVKLDELRNHSAWGSDYFTLSALYELDWLRENEQLVPAMWFKWDIPATLWIAARYAKTHLLSIGIELAF